MKFICKNDELFTIFVFENHILDGQITEFRMFGEGYVSHVHVNIKMRPSSVYKQIQMQFVGCREYELYEKNGDGSPYIENLKMIKDESGGYFVSFDPYLEDGIRSDKDGCFIHSEEISIVGI